MAEKSLKQLLNDEQRKKTKIEKLNETLKAEKADLAELKVKIREKKIEEKEKVAAKKAIKKTAKKTVNKNTKKKANRKK